MTKSSRGSTATLRPRQRLHAQDRAAKVPSVTSKSPMVCTKRPSSHVCAPSGVAAAAAVWACDGVSANPIAHTEHIASLIISKRNARGVGRNIAPASIRRRAATTSRPDRKRFRIDGGPDIRAARSPAGHVPSRFRGRPVRPAPMSETLSKPRVWFNGELVDHEDATIHVLSHVVHYGSSVFEGIRCYETDRGPAVFRLREHMKRLVGSAHIHRMKGDFELDALCDAVVQTIADSGLAACYIRPIIFRGHGPASTRSTTPS